MNMPRALVVGAAALALLGCSGDPFSSAAQTTTERSAVSGLEVIPLTVRGGNRSHEFRVEVAATEAEQQRGLMFRESLGPNEGMLFPFPQPRPAQFWMKNTLIPLDMIFIRADGSIARIAVNTVPHSLDPVGVDEPVAAVLEIAGGRSVELGINEGDRVSWGTGRS
jgi:uncharacterized protein